MENKSRKSTVKQYRKPKSLNHHNHNGLFAEKDEVPAVFSHTFSVDFENPVTGEDLSTKLTDWLENIRHWAEQNKFFIGHIKVIAENEDEFFLWLSTTGSQINNKGGNDWKSHLIDRCIISITAIVFGVKESDLKHFTLESLVLINKK